jgi:hypothetical protein
VGLPLSLLILLSGSDVDAPWMSSLAHRIWDVPNPYEHSSVLPSGLPLAPDAPPLPEPARPTRYFVIEDSADQMGIPLSPNVLMGFQVEFVGPAEEPAAAQKIIRIPHDPYHPMFLMPTIGVRIQF